MGVSKNRGIPKWMVKIMEHPIKHGMIWGGVFPLFLETSIIWCVKGMYQARHKASFLHFVQGHVATAISDDETECQMLRYVTLEYKARSTANHQQHHPGCHISVAFLIIFRWNLCTWWTFYPPWKLTARTWESMVGRWMCFWGFGLFSGDFTVSFREGGKAWNISNVKYEFIRMESFNRNPNNTAPEFSIQQKMQNDHSNGWSVPQKGMFSAFLVK